jgi:hypothetical protein
VDGPTACYKFTAPVPDTATYYLQPGGTLADGNSLYVDGIFSNIVADGFYSNGVDYWEVNVAASGGVLSNGTPCPQTTTTTTSTSTTSTSTSTTSTTTTEAPTTTTTTAAPAETTTTTTAAGTTTTTTLAPGETSTTTTTTTAAPTSTTTTTTTTAAPTSTTTTTAAPTSVNILISNSSLDVPITDVSINGVFLSGPFPVYASENKNFTSTQLGTFDVTIYYGGHIPGQNIVFLDSDNTITCKDLNGSASSFTIVAATITGGSDIAITVADGACA